MRICYLADAVSPHTRKWAHHFSSCGHNVEIISQRPALDSLPHVPVHVVAGRWPTQLSWFISAPKVREILDKFQPDIVHAHYATSYGTLARLCGFHPYILSVWGSDVYDFPKKSWLHCKLIEMNLAAPDHLCSTSKNMAAEMRRYCKRPISVTPFGVDCERFRPAPGTNRNGEEFVIGTLKALEPVYGIEDLIRSFALVKRKYSGRRKLRLVIGGDGSLRNTLVELAGRLGVMDSVTFLGAIPHSQVPKLLNTLSVFCALSLRESFGVAIIEALACEVPVVATNVGGLPEVVLDGVSGLVVSPKDVDATALAISKLIEDESLRRALGIAGRKFVLENYEWAENAKRMERVYESVLK